MFFDESLAFDSLYMTVKHILSKPKAFVGFSLILFIVALSLFYLSTIVPQIGMLLFNLLLSSPIVSFSLFIILSGAFIGYGAVLFGIREGNLSGIVFKSLISTIFVFIVFGLFYIIYNLAFAAPGFDVFIFILVIILALLMVGFSVLANSFFDGIIAFFKFLTDWYEVIWFILLLLFLLFVILFPLILSLNAGIISIAFLPFIYLYIGVFCSNALKKYL